MKTTQSHSSYWWEHVYCVALGIDSTEGLHIHNLNPEKIKVSQEVTEYLTLVCEHNTVILSYVPVYTLPHDPV